MNCDQTTRLVKSVMSILEWLIGFGGTALISVGLLKVFTIQQQERRLREAFYYLIESHEGHVSLIELAAIAKVDAEPAKNYLETQAQVFSVLPEIDPNGNTFYQFPKLPRSLPVLKNDEW